MFIYDFFVSAKNTVEEIDEGKVITKKNTIRMEPADLSGLLKPERTKLIKVLRRKKNFVFSDLKTEMQPITTSLNNDLRLLAKYGLVPAFNTQYYLAERYYFGCGVNQDYIRAFEYNKLAAEKGEIGAQYKLGYQYYYGFGVEPDIRKGFEFVKRAADQGFAYAQFWLGMNEYQFKRLTEREKDYLKDDQSIEYLEKAAEQDHRQAQVQIGIRMCSSDDKNTVDSSYWYKRAAKNGFPEAYYYLACMHNDGRTIPRDFDQAIYYFKKAGTLGHAPSLLHLGLIFTSGKDVEPNLDTATAFMNHAAMQCDPYALLALALNPLVDSIKNPKQLDTAKDYYRKALKFSLIARPLLTKEYLIGRIISDFVEYNKSSNFCPVTNVEESQLSDPRQSRGLIYVSPLKGAFS